MKIDFEPLLRFVAHLPKSGDPELTLLKCHLLVEEVLTKLITRRAREPECVMRARLSFSQKIWLARAYSDSTLSEWVWVALKKLNDARNQLSHGLSADEIFGKTLVFVESVERSEPKLELDGTGPLPERFRLAAFALYSSISFHAHFDPANIGLTIPTLLTAASDEEI